MYIGVNLQRCWERVWNMWCGGSNGLCFIFQIIFSYFSQRLLDALGVDRKGFLKSLFSCHIVVLWYMAVNALALGISLIGMSFKQ